MSIMFMSMSIMFMSMSMMFMSMSIMFMSMSIIFMCMSIMLMSMSIMSYLSCLNHVKEPLMIVYWNFCDWVIRFYTSSNYSTYFA